MYIDYNYLEDRYSADVIDSAATDEHGSINHELVNNAIDYASDLADSYLSNTYALPLVSPSDSFKIKIGDIVLYRLLGDRATESIISNYKDAIKYFEAITKGAIKLNAQTKAGNSIAYAERKRDHVFTKNTLAGF
jgi:phage gp36-like protein